MLASLALMLVTGLLAAIDDVFAVFLIVPLLCFVIGFAWLLYSVFFAEKRTPLVKGIASQPHAARIMPAQLATAAPIESFTAQRVETAEMVEPPSVTENTTRFFEEDSNPRRR